MDEFPLVATDGENISGDGFNMQTIRSKRGFVIAATQGLVGLDLSIGEQARRRLMTNFNNVFVFKSNEHFVGHFEKSIRKKKQVCRMSLLYLSS